MSVAFAACCMSGTPMSMPSYDKKMKINEVFLPKSQILPIEKKLLLIGLLYKQIHEHGWYVAQNVWNCCKIFENWYKGFINRAKIPDFQTYHMVPLKIYFMEKSGKKGL